MGQIQSSINQALSGVIGGAVVKDLTGDSIHKKLKGQDEIDDINELVGGMIGSNIAQEEKMEELGRQEAEREHKEKMFNTVAAKHGVNATNRMSETELQDRYYEITDPNAYEEEQFFQEQGSREFQEEQINKLVNAGFDPDRATTLVTTGVDTMDNPEAAIPNYNYDSTIGKQANNISLKQSMTKKRLNKSFENRLANAKSRKIRKQSVGGKN